MSYRMINQYHEKFKDKRTTMYLYFLLLFMSQSSCYYTYHCTHAHMLKKENGIPKTEDGNFLNHVLWTDEAKLEKSGKIN